MKKSKKKKNISILVIIILSLMAGIYIMNATGILKVKKDVDMNDMVKKYEYVLISSSFPKNKSFMDFYDNKGTNIGEKELPYGAMGFSSYNQNFLEDGNFVYASKSNDKNDDKFEIIKIDKNTLKYSSIETKTSVTVIKVGKEYIYAMGGAHLQIIDKKTEKSVFYDRLEYNISSSAIDEYNGEPILFRCSDVEGDKHKEKNTVEVLKFDKNQKKLVNLLDIKDSSDISSSLILDDTLYVLSKLESEESIEVQKNELIKIDLKNKKISRYTLPKKHNNGNYIYKSLLFNNSDKIFILENVFNGFYSENKKLISYNIDNNEVKVNNLKEKYNAMFIDKNNLVAFSNEYLCEYDKETVDVKKEFKLKELNEKNMYFNKFGLKK
ncbi:hypothetical protein [Peptostreptococcus faecalis]|uniref:hypothetical protein n=1 Tax=Peptostreptococcus faecalis TaxID=2045015 RepID=UPI000C7BA4E4|nr:hypothetical protein [Peptostreptococcus faecalis]